MVGGEEHKAVRTKCLRVSLKQHISFSYVPLSSFVAASLACVVFLVLAVKKIIRY